MIRSVTAKKLWKKKKEFSLYYPYSISTINESNNPPVLITSCTTLSLNFSAIRDTAAVAYEIDSLLLTRSSFAKMGNKAVK